MTIKLHDAIEQAMEDEGLRFGPADNRPLNYMFFKDGKLYQHYIDQYQREHDELANPFFTFSFKGVVGEWELKGHE